MNYYYTVEKPKKRQFTQQNNSKGYVGKITEKLIQYHNDNGYVSEEKCGVICNMVDRDTGLIVEFNGCRVIIKYVKDPLGVVYDYYYYVIYRVNWNKKFHTERYAELTAKKENEDGGIIFSSKIFWHMYKELKDVYNASPKERIVLAVYIANEDKFYYTKFIDFFNSKTEKKTFVVYNQDHYIIDKEAEKNENVDQFLRNRKEPKIVKLEMTAISKSLFSDKDPFN